VNVWVLLVGSLVVGVLVGYWIGSVKGQPRLGAILGIFGIIGWIVMALLPKRTSPVELPADAVHSATTDRPADLPHGALPPHPGHVDPE
jgi:uncharacterized membrane protein YfcA